MRQGYYGFGLTLMVSASAILSGCQARSAAAAGEPLDRGRYLVEQAAMCADCHSPRRPDGSLDRQQWLKGAPLGFTPIHPMPVWAAYAPDITGSFAGWTEEQLTTFLATGKTPQGLSARPPMPEYKFNPEDARAIAIYLRSLGHTEP